MSHSKKGLHRIGNLWALTEILKICSGKGLEKASFLSFSFLFYKNLFYLGNIKIDQFYLGACSERICIIEEIRYWEEPKGHLWAQICCADLYDSRNLKVMWAARRPWLKFVHSLLWKCFLNSMRLQGNYEKGCPLWLKESQKPHSRFHF